jgi:hypothetical protein
LTQAWRQGPTLLINVNSYVCPGPHDPRPLPVEPVLDATDRSNL